MVAKPQKGSVVDRLAGSLNHLVSKSILKIPTQKAIRIAGDIAAKEIAPCGECKDPKGVYIIEEVDHIGETHNYAHVCQPCVPQSMWPQGD